MRKSACIALTMPTGYSWSLPGQRKRTDYESPQGWRVNARARPYGTSPRLEVFTAKRTWDFDVKPKTEKASSAKSVGGG